MKHVWDTPEKNISQSLYLLCKCVGWRTIPVSYFMDRHEAECTKSYCELHCLGKWAVRRV